MATTEILTPTHLFRLSEWARVLGTTVPALVLAGQAEDGPEDPRIARAEARLIEHGGW